MDPIPGNLGTTLGLRAKRITFLNIGTGMEYSTGLMGPITKASGISIKLKAKVLFGMLRVTFIEENSKMIWPTGTESILTSMEAGIKVNLETMSKKAMGKKNG